MSQLFSNRNYSLFYAGQSLSRLGDNVSILAMVWLAHVLTNSTVFMSVVLAVGVLPRVLIAPVSGVLVERWHKRTCMIAADLIRGTSLVLLVVLVVNHSVTAWVLLLLSFLLSTMSTIATPANVVLQKMIVPKELLLKANALNQTTLNIMQIAGPAIAGFLIGLGGLAVSFAVDAVSFFVSVFTLLLIHPDEPPRSTAPLTTESIVGDLASGMKIFWSFPTVRALAPFMMLYTFFIIAIENLLIVQYVANTLHMNNPTVVVGTINSFMAVGELVGSLLVVYVTSKIQKEKVQMFCLMISASMIFCTGISHYVALICVYFFVAGASMSIANVSFFTSLQQAIPNESLSRVWSILGAVFNAVYPAGQLVFGGIAGVVSVAVVIPVMGVLGFLAGLSAFLTPAYRSLTSPASHPETQLSES